MSSLPPPRQVTIAGEVDAPQTLALRDLLALSRDDVTIDLQAAGPTIALARIGR